MSAIAFIGLGQMGAPMAKNLLKQGHQLNVFDVNPQAVQALGSMEKGLFLYEKGGLPLKKALCAPAAQIGIFVGAEGGFSSEEAHLAQEAGATCTSLGNRILRCETAPLAALSAILYETDNF